MIILTEALFKMTSIASLSLARKIGSAERERQSVF